LAGPLCLGAVVYDPSFITSVRGVLPGIDDSKKLSPRRRADALEFIRAHALFCSSILVSHRTIDRLNINGATEFALRRLIKTMPMTPDIVLMDGNFSFDLPVPLRSIKKGDTLSISIASASIAAKVRRDGILESMDAIYPAYGFRNNKGYGTRAHIRAIYESGFSPVHRLSYEPVKSLSARGESKEEK
ncbi:MAG: ribonuclease HII, partial [Chrysiogenales bacterium]